MQCSIDTFTEVSECFFHNNHVLFLAMIFVISLFLLLQHYAALIFPHSCPFRCCFVMSVSAKHRVPQNCHYRPAGVIPGRTRCHGAKSFGSVQSCCRIEQKVDPEWNSGVSSKRGMYGIEKNIANDVY